MNALLARFGRKSKPQNDDSYYTAGQFALIKARFKRKTSGVVAAWILGTLVLMGFFAPFFSPVDPTINGADGLPPRCPAGVVLLG